MRRGAAEAFSKATAPKFHEFQAQEVIQLALEIMSEPMRYHDHFLRFSTSLVMSITYGMSTLELGDKNIDNIMSFVNDVAASMIPGAYLVEMLPWIRHIPSR